MLRKDGDGLSLLLICLDNIILMRNLKMTKDQRHFLSECEEVRRMRITMCALYLVYYIMVLS